MWGDGFFSRFSKKSSKALQLLMDSNVNSKHFIKNKMFHFVILNLYN